MLIGRLTVAEGELPSVAGELLDLAAAAEFSAAVSDSAQELAAAVGDQTLFATLAEFLSSSANHERLAGMRARDLASSVGAAANTYATSETAIAAAAQPTPAPGPAPRPRPS